MTNIISQNDIIDAIGTVETARISGDSAGLVIDESRVASAIQQAQSIAKSFLHKRYPNAFLGDVDELVKKIVLDLAIAELYETNSAMAVFAGVAKSRKLEALNSLEMLRKGDLSLNSDSISTKIYSNKTADDTIFSKSVLDDFFGG